MKAKGKKLVTLFLIFSLMMLSANLYAKERRGATLIITKTDGRQIRGELITVKPNSLLLLDTEGKDVSVGIGDIKVIQVVKKTNALAWAAIGFAAGVLSAPYIFIVEDPPPAVGILLVRFVGGAIGAIGVLFAALVFGSAGKDKIIQIKGMTDSEIQETMDKLRKKARIRDYE